VQLTESDVREKEDLLFVVLRDRPLRFLLIVAVQLAAQALLVLELFVLLRTTRAAFLGAGRGYLRIIFKTVHLPASAGLALAVARRLRSLLLSGTGLALAPLWTDSTPSREPDRGSSPYAGNRGSAIRTERPEVECVLLNSILHDPEPAPSKEHSARCQQTSFARFTKCPPPIRW
jgi:hypothetical protein